MNDSSEVVTRIPVETLWADADELQRGQQLDSAAIRQLIRQQPVQFVVADVGLPLRWVVPAQCYAFWKQEAEPHLVDTKDRVVLEQYLEEYAYRASEWFGKVHSSVILLEKLH
jgi:hypothetical protein